MTISPHAGQFYSFEENEGGNLVGLIRRVYKFDQEEAKSWVSRFLADVGNISVPEKFSVQNFSQKEDSWVSMRPLEKSSSPPPLSSLAPGLAKKYAMAARYVYKDEEGRTLFHCLRLQDKQDPSKKQILPLSYGHTQGNEKSPRWRLKGYKSDLGKPLYHQELLRAHVSVKGTHLERK